MRAVEEFTRKNYWLALLVMISSLKLIYAPLVTEDLFIWVAAGLKMIDLGQFISQDYFTIHHGLTFVYPSQLSNLLYGMIFKIGGSTLLFVVLRLIGIFFLFYIYQKYLKQVEKNIWNLILAISFIFGIFYMIDRPQYLAFVPALMAFSLLDDSQFDLKAKIYFLAIIIFWSNIHSSVLILIPVLGSRIILETLFYDLKKLKVTLSKLILLIIGICVTPIRFDIFKYLFSTFMLSSKRFNGEWRGLLIYQDKFLVITILLIMFYLFAMLFKTKQLKAYILSGYFILPVMTFISVRHAVFFCLVNFIIFNQYRLWINGKNILESTKSTLVLSLLFSLSIYLLMLNWKENHFLDEHYDASLISYMRNESNLQIYHEIDGGLLSALLFENNNKYFIDARNIIFTDEMYRDYSLLKQNLEIPRLIKKYGFDTFIVKKKNTKMIQVLLELGWQKKFEGDKTILFLKRA